MSQRPFHWLIVGSTGGGKTYRMTRVLRAYVRKARYLVVVNTTEELSEFARHRVVIDNPALALDHDPAALARLIHKHGAVHFEVTPGAPLRVAAFMDALCEAVMRLGRLHSPNCRVLFCVDEAQNYLSQKVFTKSDAPRRVYTEGRKFGIHTLTGTLQFSGAGTDVIDMQVKKMISVVIVCPMDEENEVAKLRLTYPELGDPSGMQFPDGKTGRAGGYMVRDRVTRRALVVRVTRDGATYARALLGELPRPQARRRA